MSNNREQRRAKGLPKDRTFTVKESQLEAIAHKRVVEEIDKIRASVVAEVTEVITKLMLVYDFIVLHDKFGFDREQLVAFKDHLNALGESLESGYCSNTDLHKLCLEEFGIDIDEMLNMYGIELKSFLKE